MIKGRFRSVARTRLIDEARELARLGTKEIVLIAQDTAGYGVDLYGKPMIVDLVSDLSGIEGVRWIRLMYAHPKSLSEDLVREIGRNPRVCKYLDMPIQHISDRLLRLMNRHVSRRRIELLVRMLRSVPGMTLRTTVIAGFPTETAAEFRELHSFLEKGYFDWFGVFPYCREKGTPAADLAQNSAAEIRRRCKALASLQRGIIREKNRLRLNNVYMTLVHRHNGGYIGHTEFSAPQTDGSVHIQGTNVRIGDFCDIRIRRTKGSELYGDIA
jgi:ribosomal protein S12 methylthiotransferase